MAVVLDDNLRRLLKAIREVTTPERVYLFGSRARGDQRDWSDYDLLVLTDDPRDRYEMNVAVRQSVDRPAIAVDLFFLSPAEYERWRLIPGTLARAVADEGVVISD